MDILKKVINSLTDKEKFEIFAIISLLFLCTILVLSAIAWSRGQDVDYFKEKIFIIEERLNINDRRDNDQGDKLSAVDNKLAEAERDITIIAINVAATQHVVKEIVNPPNKKQQTIPPFEKLPPLPAPKKTVNDLRPLTAEEQKKLKSQN